MNISKAQTHILKKCEEFVESMLSYYHLWGGGEGLCLIDSESTPKLSNTNLTRFSFAVNLINHILCLFQVAETRKC